MKGSSPKPGWYRDPAGSEKLRYWDGKRWSKNLRDRPASKKPKPPKPRGPEAGRRLPVGLAAALLGVLSALWIIFLPVGLAGMPECNAVAAGQAELEDGECHTGYEKDKTRFLIGSGLAGALGLATAGFGLAYARTGRFGRAVVALLAATILAAVLTILFLDLTILTYPTG